MFIIFGTKTVTEPVPNGLRVTRFCARCNTQVELVEHQARKYFTFFFLPLFPTEKGDTFLECARCSAAYYPTADDYVHAAAARGAPATPGLVVHCPQCGSHLRVPVLNKRIRITCSHCQHKFDFDRQHRDNPPRSDPTPLAHRRSRSRRLPLTVAAMTLVAALIIAVLLLRGSSQTSKTVELPTASAAPPPSQTLVPPNVSGLRDRLERLRLSLCERAKTSGRPSDGSELIPDYRRGSGRLTVSNGTAHDAAVMLVRPPSSTIAGIFIRSSSTVSLKDLPDGVYEIQYAIGEGWLPRIVRFCDPSSFGRFESLVTFTTAETATADGVEVEATTYRITLHPVPGGTARTRPITPESFAPGLGTRTNPDSAL